MRGSALRSARAQVAPPKPPPSTTTRAAALCARTAGDKMAADAAAAIADLSTLRRFGRIRSISAVGFGVCRAAGPPGNVLCDRKPVVLQRDAAEAFAGRRED